MAGDSGETELTSGLVKQQFAKKVLSALKTQLSAIPEALLASGLNSNVSWEETNNVEATARLTAIFAMRGKTYRPIVHVDRGADTPDKSWMSIARKNYKVYGLDIKMLDEFYKIAADNGW